MRFQDLPFSCGASAIVNALRALGRRVPERTVRALAGTTPEEGTNEQGMCYAIRELGFTATKFETQNSAQAWAMACSNQPFIITTQLSQHWITIIGVANGKMIVIDPSNAVANKSENGIHVWSKREFLRKWKDRNNIYFGIMVHKR